MVLESILRLRPENLCPKYYWVSLTARGICNHIFHTTYIAEELFERLYELSKTSCVYIFHSKSGAPIDAALIRRSFIKACKNLGWKNVITPLHLRQAAILEKSDK